jgi:cobalt-zinc-cadmium efflux system membrane fusion protein
MTMIERLMWGSLLIFTAGCGAPATITPREETAAANPDTASPAADANVVRVSDEMLRDLRVTTSPVEQHQGPEAVSMLGELGVNLNHYAEIGSPLQARVIALHAVEGQMMRRGSPLATLQSGELARARSEVATARARLELSRQALERKQGLNRERIVPAREVQEAENELVAAEQQWRASRASLQAFGAPEEPAADANPSTLVITAPIAGTIIERTVVLGQMVDPVKPLFTITDLASVWLTVHAFERDAVRVRLGETVRIAFAALPGRSFSGGVSFVGRSVESESRTVPVRIELANPDGLLRPGMSATAWLPMGDASGVILTVPAAALQRVRDRWCVFIPRDASSFEIRAVGRGRDLAEEVEVVSGLRAGDIVVVDGAFLLKAESEKAAGEHGEH